MSGSYISLPTPEPRVSPGVCLKKKLNSLHSWLFYVSLEKQRLQKLGWGDGVGNN